MGTKHIAELRERFERDGYVEFGVRGWKVAAHLVFYVGMLAGFPVFGFQFGPVGIVLGVLAAVWFAGAVGTAFAEQVRGSGPALRVDPVGLSIRRWGQPLSVPWGEIEGIGPYGGSKLVAPLLAIFLSPDAWDDYQRNRPAWPKRMDRFTSFKKLQMLTPFKVLDTSSRDLIAFLDRDVVLGWIELGRPPKLLLTATFDESSPITFRNGVEVPLVKLAISQSLAGSLTEWNNAVTALASQPEGEQQDRPLTADEEAAFAKLQADGRVLAVHVASELGAGAVVRASYDPIG